MKRRRVWGHLRMKDGSMIAVTDKRVADYIASLVNLCATQKAELDALKEIDNGDVVAMPPDYLDVVNAATIEASDRMGMGLVDSEGRPAP